MYEYKKPNKKLLKVKKIVFAVISTFFKLLVCVIFAFPFLWMISTSFKTLYESLLYPPTLLPQNFTVDAYISLFEQVHLERYILNSLIILVSVTLLQVLIMVPAAYAFAKYNFKMKGVLFGAVMVAFMVPTQITFVSVFQMFSKMQLLDTLLPQIIPCICNAFGIFLLRQNFMQIPEELLESARLDEAGELKIMLKIMLPMSKSTLVTIMLLSMIGTWNSYFWPLVMTLHDSVRPITIAIQSLRNLEGGLEWPIIMAGNVILVLPVLILFFLASKKIIEAMAYRGVK